jgi:two-component system response regulator (stage 0 sporulation protein A)
VDANRCTVLVVDDNGASRRQLMDAFDMQAEFAVIGEARTGQEAIDLAQALRPDLLILDDVLPMFDGLGVLSRLPVDHRMRIFVILSCASDRLIQLYYEHGAHYCLLRPFEPELVVERARQLLGQGQPVGRPPARPLSVGDLLKRTGVPTHLDGYRYLQDAVQYMLERGGQISGMTKDVYPTVARMNSTIPARVERSMRHAIEVAWNRADLSELHRLFGATVHHRRGKPTNSEFVSLLADHLKNIRAN